MTGTGEIAALVGLVDRPTGVPATIRAPGVSMLMPALIADAGEDAARFTLEFFMARIPNRNTRAAYGRAVGRFCRWCEARGVAFASITTSDVAAYLEALQTDGLAIPSVKLQLAALRHWLDWLTQKGGPPVTLPPPCVGQSSRSAKEKRRCFNRMKPPRYSMQLTQPR
jgi:hypothetical protein